MLALYVVAGLVVLGILILSIPVDMAFEVSVPGEPRSRMRIGWLFGLVGKEIKARKPKPVEEVEEEEKKKRDMRPLFSLMRVKGLPERLLRLVRQMLRRVHFRRLDADVTLGLDDPADTGFLCAAAWPAMAYLNSLRPVSVTFQPCFVEPLAEIQARGSIRVFPIEMAGPVLSFTCSPPLWRAIKVMAVSRWRGRK